MSASNSPQYLVKAVFNGKLKIFQLGAPTMASLWEKIGSAFDTSNDVNSQTLQGQYVDKDGESIFLDTDEELMLAFAICDVPLRINVEPRANDADPVAVLLRNDAVTEGAFLFDEDGVVSATKVEEAILDAFSDDDDSSSSDDNDPESGPWTHTDPDVVSSAERNLAEFGVVVQARNLQAFMQLLQVPVDRLSRVGMSPTDQKRAQGLKKMAKVLAKCDRQQMALMDKYDKVEAKLAAKQAKADKATNRRKDQATQSSAGAPSSGSSAPGADSQYDAFGDWWEVDQALPAEGKSGVRPGGGGRMMEHLQRKLLWPFFYRQVLLEHDVDIDAGVIRQLCKLLRIRKGKLFRRGLASRKDFATYSCSQDVSALLSRPLPQPAQSEGGILDLGKGKGFGWKGKGRGKGHRLHYGHGHGRHGHAWKGKGRGGIPPPGVFAPCEQHESPPRTGVAVGTNASHIGVTEDGNVETNYPDFGQEYYAEGEFDHPDFGQPDEGAFWHDHGHGGYHGKGKGKGMMMWHMKGKGKEKGHHQHHMWMMEKGKGKGDFHPHEHHMWMMEKGKGKGDFHPHEHHMGMMEKGKGKGKGMHRHMWRHGGQKGKGKGRGGGWGCNNNDARPAAEGLDSGDNNTLGGGCRGRSRAWGEESGEGGKCLARFVSHVTVPDGTVVEPGESFLKIWSVRNDGNQPWPVGCELVAVGGGGGKGKGKGKGRRRDDDRGAAQNADGSSTALVRGAAFHVPHSAIAPAKEVSIALDFRAPHEPGVYQVFFRLRDAVHGKKFGQRLWFSIMVKERVTCMDGINPVQPIGSGSRAFNDGNKNNAGWSSGF